MRKVSVVVAAILGTAVGIGLGVGTAVAEDIQVIEFNGRNVAPLGCTSYPNETSFTIQNGERITLANFTGTSATIDVGKTDPLVVENGSGVTVKLKKGTHQLLMTPQCLLTHSEPVTIHVVVPEPQNGGTTAPGSPGDPGTRPGSEGPNTDLPAPLVTTATTAAGSPYGGSVGVISSPATTSVGSDDPTTTVADDPTSSSPVLAAGSPFLEVGPAHVLRTDEAGRNLLALIAAICVSGVSIGIYRAIIAQRTAKVASP